MTSIDTLMQEKVLQKVLLCSIVYHLQFNLPTPTIILAFPIVEKKYKAAEISLNKSIAIYKELNINSQMI
jgi:uncharacterized protein YqcC (DUF446 family)